MLHTPLTRTLPVGLADSYASARIEIGSAYTLIFFAVVLPALWAMQSLAALLGPRTETKVGNRRAVPNANGAARSAKAPE